MYVKFCYTVSDVNALTVEWTCVQLHIETPLHDRAVALINRPRSFLSNIAKLTFPSVSGVRKKLQKTKIVRKAVLDGKGRVCISDCLNNLISNLFATFITYLINKALIWGMLELSNV